MSKSNSYQAIPISDEIASHQEAAYRQGTGRQIYVTSPPPPPPRYIAPQPGNNLINIIHAYTNTYYHQC